jgi:3-deoxy-D-manno-octulosonic-acid transferase
MYLLYSIVLVTWGILLIPFALYRAWRYQKHFPGLSQRLGNLPGSLRSNGQSTIWFHACSVGETLSLQPLVHALHARFPQARFVFSTVTQTGQTMAAQHFKVYGEGNTFYFPIDLAFVIRRVLDWIRPTMIVIIDTEIWPNLVNQAHRRGIPLVLANGRISAASFPYYRYARPVLSRVLRKYRLLMMQSDEDARRITAIGAPREKIMVSGNIKFDKNLIEKTITGQDAADLETSFLGNNQDSPLIVAGSTHAGEERILLATLRRVRQIPGLARTRMLLAPRHPERFHEVAGLVRQSGYAMRRRTESQNLEYPAEVLLLDTLGELAAAYRFATVAFVGGTLIRRGGHSIMEPALFAKAIVTGPSMENFRGIVKEFREHNGIHQISAGQEDRGLQIEQLTQAFVDLLQNRNAREALGKNAFSILDKNRGAAQFSAEQIATIFEGMR